MRDGRCGLAVKGEMAARSDEGRVSPMPETEVVSKELGMRRPVLWRAKQSRREALTDTPSSLAQPTPRLVWAWIQINHWDLT